MFFRKKQVNNREFPVFPEESREYTCCFTGLRPQKCPWGFNENDERFLDIREKTKETIKQSIKEGYRAFISGMALGFDIMCAEIVLELKRDYPNIKLYLAIPCKNQSSVWNESQKERYENVVEKADGLRYISEIYFEGCMQERNKFMVDNSSKVIALYSGVAGGTKQTIQYAKQNKLKIEVLNPTKK